MFSADTVSPAWLPDETADSVSPAWLPDAILNFACVYYLSNASMEASGWNDCKPIHRAVAEGHTHILQVLLRHGADVNSLDLMR